MVNSGTKAARMISVEKRMADVDLGSADEDQADAVYEAFSSARAVRKPRGASQEHFAFGRLENAENVLDKDHRRVDNDAEIDRSE